MRILVAGVGNVFHGDDAFGVFTARALEGRSLPEGVDVVDFGIRSYDLAFAILDGYDTIILVDAVRRDGSPGTVYLLEPERTSDGAGAAVGHGMTPDSVLRLLDVFGGYEGTIYVVGCEPATLQSTNGSMALSARVADAVQEAVCMIEELVDELFNHRAVMEGDTTEREGERWDES